MRCLRELAQKERIRRHLNLSNAMHRRLREHNTMHTQQHVGFYRRRTVFVPEVEATQFIDQCGKAPSWRRASLSSRSKFDVAFTPDETSHSIFSPGLINSDAKTHNLSAHARFLHLRGSRHFAVANHRTRAAKRISTSTTFHSRCPR